MKRILLLATAIFLVQTTYVPPKNVTNKAETYVYICTGPQSKRYHKTDNCKGLSRCSKTVKKVTVDKAIDLGRTKCKMCYK